MGILCNSTAGMGHEEALNFCKARSNVFSHISELWVLISGYLLLEKEYFKNRYLQKKIKYTISLLVKSR